MTTYNKLIVSALLAVSPFLTQAQSSKSKLKAESTSSSSISEVKQEKNKVAGEDVDQVLTNARLRAETGSKSKYSIKTHFNYKGGSIEKPVADERPNIGEAPGTTDVSHLIGQVSGKYAITPRHAIMAGVGLRYMTPLTGNQLPDTRKPNGEKVYDGEKFDAENPYLMGQYIYKAGAVQNFVAVQPLYFTNSNLVKQEYLARLTATHTSVWEMGKSGVSLGLYNELYYNQFKTEKEGQNDYAIGISPYIEWQMNKSLNLRTVFNPLDFYHSRARDFFTYDQGNDIQSFGLGIAVTRDIFLYPNLQFILDDIRADRTNVALETFINVF